MPTFQPARKLELLALMLLSAAHTSCATNYRIVGMLQEGSGNSCSLSGYELLLYKIASKSVVTWDFRTDGEICDAIVVCTLSATLCDSVLNDGAGFTASDCIDSVSELSQCWGEFRIDSEGFSSGGCVLVIDYDRTDSTTTMDYDLYVQTESDTASSTISVAWIVIYTLVAFLGLLILGAVLICSKRCLVPTVTAVALGDPCFEMQTPQIQIAAVPTNEHAGEGSITAVTASSISWQAQNVEPIRTQNEHAALLENDSASF